MRKMLRDAEFQSTPPVWAETSMTSFAEVIFSFQSTPPVWAETNCAKQIQTFPTISIHSARVGGDIFPKANA